MSISFKETEDTITLHGLGFLQVKLEGNQRLHVWHPDLPRRSCFEHSSVHDHRFGFVSRILVGEQNNQLYRVVPKGSFDPHTFEKFKPTHTAYLHEGERTKFGNRPWLPDGNLILEKTQLGTYGPGQEYTMEPYIYHSTHPGGNGKVATLMTKTYEGIRGAHSLCEIGIQPDVDFDRKQWTADRLWSIVRDVLGG